MNDIHGWFPSLFFYMPALKRIPERRHLAAAANKNISRKVTKPDQPATSPAKKKTLRKAAKQENRRASTLTVTTDKPERLLYSATIPDPSLEMLKSQNTAWMFYFWPSNKHYKSFQTSEKAVLAFLRSRGVATTELSLHFPITERGVFRSEREGEWLYAYKISTTIPNLKRFRSSLDSVTSKYPDMVIQDFDDGDTGVFDNLVRRFYPSPDESSTSKERAAGPAPASNDDERPVALRKGKRNLVQSRVA